MFLVNERGIENNHKRRVIFPQRDEVEMINEGKMRNVLKHYLTSDGVVKSIKV